MKYFLLCLLLLNITFSYSQTQNTITNEAKNDFLKADENLNSLYQTILKEYKSDTLFIQNLKAAQRIWIDFRDAEMNMMFPDYGGGYYGSSHSTCVFLYKSKLTKQRTSTLLNWIRGIEEGELCKGSLKLESR